MPSVTGIFKLCIRLGLNYPVFVTTDEQMRKVWYKTGMARSPITKAPFLKGAQLWLMNKLGETLIWAVLTVLFSLFPIYLVYNDKRMGGILTIPVKELVMRGELLLVAAALAADSLARLASRTFSRRDQAGVFGFEQLVLFLASISFILLASSEYAGLVSRTAQNTLINADYVFTQSKFLFIAMIFTGASVILVD